MSSTGKQKYFGKPGSTFVLSTETEPAPEDIIGLVRMVENRPGADYECHPNLDGTGEWVKIKKTESDELRDKVSNIKGRVVYYAWWVIVNFRRTRYWWITKSGYPALRTPAFMSNLLFSFDYRKTTVACCFFIPLLLIHIFEIANGSTLSDLLLATVAAAIFDFIINVVPRERNKYRNTALIFEKIETLVMIKNTQYMSIGLIDEPWADFELKAIWDDAMTKAKATNLIKLLHSSINNQPSAAIYNIPRTPFRKSIHTNGELLFESHAIFKTLLEELTIITDKDLFPLFHSKLLKISDYLKILDTIFLPSSPSVYASCHFRYIETLQLFYMIECARYRSRHHNLLDVPMRYSWESIGELAEVHMSFYADSK